MLMLCSIKPLLEVFVSTAWAKPGPNSGLMPNYLLNVNLQVAAPAEGITTVALMLVALMAAAMPKGADSSSSSTATAATSSSGKDIDVPLRYDPDALSVYWSKHPMQVGGGVNTLLALRPWHGLLIS